MVKRNKDAHQSNHYKATNNSGGKANKKSGGKAGKGNKSINKFLGIGKPGPHLLKHKKLQEAKKEKKQAPRPTKNTGKNTNNNNNSKIRKGDLSKKNSKKGKKAQRSGGNGEGTSSVSPKNKCEDSRWQPDIVLDTSDRFGRHMPYKGEQHQIPPFNDNTAQHQHQTYRHIPHQETQSQSSYSPTMIVPMAEGRNDTSSATSTVCNPQSSTETKKRKNKEKKERKKLRNERKAQRKESRAAVSGAEDHREKSQIPVDQEESNDDVALGADFIPFDIGNEDNIEAQESTPVSNAPTDNAIFHHGQKRKRDPDYGSDTEGSTGPPAGCPWMGHRQYSKMPSVPLMLTQELKDFVDYISPTREEHQVRKYVLQRVELACRALWGKVQVEIFGSYDTQLYLPSSDLDIVVLRDRAFTTEDLYSLSRHLKRSGLGQDITVIAKARVPIVKFKEAVSKLPVDVSFNITSGIEGAQVVKSYMSEWPVLRPFTMLIKYFLMIKGYNEVFMGGIGSYTTMIMILSFLQMHPHIQACMINPEDNLGVLVIEFFELYGHCFNYHKVGIRVDDGGSYFVKPIKQQPPQQWGRPARQELLLSSIDPNDPDNDTARASYQLSKIREVFVGAYAALTQNVQKRHKELFGGQDGAHSQEQPRHVRFDDHNRVPADSVEKSTGLHRHTQVSLVKDVFSMSFDLRASRQHIESVFYGGFYQNLFDDPKGIRGLDEIDNY
ncbi:hypothetical protein BGX28_002761 [Mortierella sp. GBA30]|nr:hypothetical protein BGX28_002761 [Mortierella sp. GBA30]